MFWKNCLVIDYGVERNSKGVQDHIETNSNYVCTKRKTELMRTPPKLSLSDVMQRIKGRSSRRIQMEFPELRKRY